jgi:hypothetical protein
MLKFFKNLNFVGIYVCGYVSAKSGTRQIFKLKKWFIFASDQSKTLRVQLETFRKAIEMILESNELLSPEEEKAREAELKAKKMQLAVQEEIFLLNLKK